MIGPVAGRDHRRAVVARIEEEPALIVFGSHRNSIPDGEALRRLRFRQVDHQLFRGHRVEKHPAIVIVDRMNGDRVGIDVQANVIDRLRSFEIDSQLRFDRRAAHFRNRQIDVVTDHIDRRCHRYGEKESEHVQIDFSGVAAGLATGRRRNSSLISSRTLSASAMSHSFTPREAM